MSQGSIPHNSTKDPLGFGVLDSVVDHGKATLIRINFAILGDAIAQASLEQRTVVAGIKDLYKPYYIMHFFFPSAE